MKKLLLVILVVVFALPVFVHGQQLYSEGQRNPETDTNVDLYISSWKDGAVFHGHGGFVEQAYFVPGDALDPPAPGAVLEMISAYNHGILAEHTRTQPTKHDDEQVIFFVIDGFGTVTAGGETHDIREGHGIFIPRGLEYYFNNTGDVPMNVVIIVEEVPSSFDAQDDISIGNWHDHPTHAGGHWSHVERPIFRPGPKYYHHIGGPSLVSMETFDIAHPHAHGGEFEEIWNQIKGDSFMHMGKYLRHQPKGTAIYIPPTGNGKDPHASINPDDNPVRWLYMSVRPPD